MDFISHRRQPHTTCSGWAPSVKEQTTTMPVPFLLSSRSHIECRRTRIGTKQTRAGRCLCRTHVRFESTLIRIQLVTRRQEIKMVFVNFFFGHMFFHEKWPCQFMNRRFILECFHRRNCAIRQQTHRPKTMPFIISFISK